MITAIDSKIVTELTEIVRSFLIENIREGLQKLEVLDLHGTDCFDVEDVYKLLEETLEGKINARVETRA